MNREPEPIEGGIEAAAARWVARRDAGLSSAEQQELQRWLERDPRHRAALAYYDAAWSALAKPSQSGGGEAFEKELAALRRRRHGRIATAAAVLIVLLMVNFWMRRPVADTPVPAQRTAVVVAPQRQVLPDGSLVELKGDARITIEYGDTIRRVRLGAGEAYFAVQKDAARPFVVSAGKLEVRAVGTEFSVGLDRSEVEIVVTKGQVALAASAGSGKPGDAAEPLATVDAGQRVLVKSDSSGNPRLTLAPADEVPQRLAWRRTRLEFTKTQLMEAVALFNEHAPKTAPRLVIADPTVAGMRVTGIFRADNVEAFVLLLEQAFGITADRSADTISLRPAR